MYYRSYSVVTVCCAVLLVCIRVLIKASFYGINSIYSGVQRHKAGMKEELQSIFVP